MEALASRRSLLLLVERYPGLHVRELARQANMSEALAHYHLQHLVSDDLVEALDDGNFRRFYPCKSKAPPDEDRDLMALLRRRVPLQIALVLLERGSATNQQLAEEIGLAKSTMSYHLNMLEQARFLHRAEASEQVALEDPKRVARLLTRWQPPRDAVSRFGELWNRFYTGHKKPRP